MWRVIATLLVLVVASSCTGGPFGIRPVVSVPAETISPPARGRQIDVRAAALWDEDWQLDTYDANLVLAGLLPVRVAVTNVSGRPLDLGKLRFDLRNSQSRRQQWIKAAAAIRALERVYGVRVGSQLGRRRTRADFVATELPRTGTLAAGTSVQGIVYFVLREAGPVPMSMDLRVRMAGDDLHVALPASQ